MVIQELERQVHMQHSVGVKLVGSHLDKVSLETAFYKKDSVCLVKIQFRSIAKIRQCGMLKFTTHTSLKFHVCWFSVFGLTDLGFHEQNFIKTSLHGLMYIRFDLYTYMLHILRKTYFDIIPFMKTKIG